MGSEMVKWEEHAPAGRTRRRAGVRVALVALLAAPGMSAADEPTRAERLQMDIAAAQAKIDNLNSLTGKVDEWLAQRAERDPLVEELSKQLNQAIELLELERAGNQQLRSQSAKLSDELERSHYVNDDLDSKLKAAHTQAEEQRQADAKSLATALAELQAAVTALEAAGQQATVQEAELVTLRTDLDLARRSLEEVRLAKRGAETKLAKLQGLKKELGQTREHLEKEKQLARSAEAKIAQLDRRLSELGAERTQLARRLERPTVRTAERLADVRRDVFGGLAARINGNRGITADGGRLTIQSDLLFQSGSLEFTTAAATYLKALAQTLSVVGQRLPADVDWLMRIDAHEDGRPLRPGPITSKRAMSAARAVAITERLEAYGAPADRLAAAAYGDAAPADRRTDEIAFRRNRRIEFHLTAR